MLGIRQRPIAVDKMIVPPVRGDLKVMSIGFFLDDNAPVMWRGPMLHRALEQFLSDVHWGELDWLLVDMPPGTGDVSISLGQLLPRAEVVVVTTPQRAAQEVAVRAAEMARKTNMRLLGVIENMSYLVGSGEAIFGEGGGEELAREIGAPLLGRVPLDPALREAADDGDPIVLRDPDAESSQAIVALAEAILATRREVGVGITKTLPLVVDAEGVTLADGLEGRCTDACATTSSTPNGEGSAGTVSPGSTSSHRSSTPIGRPGCSVVRRRATSAGTAAARSAT